MKPLAPYTIRNLMLLTGKTYYPALMRRCVAAVLLFINSYIFSQFKGQVTDMAGKGLPFATIKFINSKEGMIADLNGLFSSERKDVKSIEVSYLNYKTRQVPVSAENFMYIRLEPEHGSLNTVTVKTTGNKLKRILNTVIANRALNNPDKYDWYKCNVYYKTVADFIVPDSVLQNDTANRLMLLKKMANDQHLFMTETYSRRTRQKPARLQEEVIASRVSGLNKSFFTSLITDILPFHSYNDFIVLNQKDYHNPVSKGSLQRFTFRLADEVIDGKDTVWLITFTPKNPEDLQGTVYINSDRFAIAHLIAHHIDTLLQRDIGIEQEYSRQEGRWFPRRLNYTFKWQPQIGNDNNALSIKGYSVIDSVDFKEDKNFTFDRAHTVKVLAGADNNADSNWQSKRPVKLDYKELRTYEFMDSLSKEKRFDRKLEYVEKISQGKFPVNKFDINLERIYTYNKYEKHRVGFGMQTNEKISRLFSLGAWAAYGFGDNRLKYGAFTELYLDRYKEFTVKGSFSSDLRDPGRLQVHKDLDRNYLRSYLMNRVDHVTQFSLAVNKRFGYLSAELTAARENIQPTYSYILASEGKLSNRFFVTEISVKLRYGYGERTVPAFGNYLSMSTPYPVVYARVNTGAINNIGAYYTQLIGAVSWQKNVNRWGKERFLLISGLSLSNKPLPLSKLFAGNGFRLSDNAFYVFGGMQTMFPYQYYSDRFVNFYWKHDFDFTLYRLNLNKRGLTSAPMPALGYNMLLGSMEQPEVHKNVRFSVPNTPYHETGIILNRVLRLRMLSLYYVTLNTGYYYYWTSQFNVTENGVFVFGLGVDL